MTGTARAICSSLWEHRESRSLPFGAGCFSRVNAKPPCWPTVIGNHAVWTGFTPTGERREIMTKQYASDKWRQACEMIVLAELQQCIGRGRGVLEAGIPVVVLSNEPLGLPLATTDVTAG